MKQKVINFTFLKQTQNTIFHWFFFLFLFFGMFCSSDQFKGGIFYRIMQMETDSESIRSQLGELVCADSMSMTIYQTT